MIQPAYIYNLFPRLAGNMTQWVDHFPRIASMKFNWVFLNPIQYPGFSGSLYSIKDYYQINPLFYNADQGPNEMEQLKWTLEQAHKHGLKVMMDLVVNHTAIDHPFTETHKNWYRLEKGKIKNPGAWDDGKWISWGDLAEINNESSDDRDNLWKYWLDMVLFYLDLGFDGFRCDAAYKLPGDFWRYLIGETKNRFPNSVWFAESLGCPIEETINLGDSGFDYTFNSSKWWDYKAEWCIEQYEQNASHSKSISFPESHDTPRLAEEVDGDPDVIKQKYFFAALFSSGIMIPIGFEFAFRKPLHVVKSSPNDFEPIHHDLSGFITTVNELKGSYQIFNEESQLNKVTVVGDPNVAILLKTSINRKERVLIIINTDNEECQKINIENYLLLLSWEGKVKDISLSNRIINIDPKKKLTLLPAEIKIFYSSMSD